jgi:hypothetical protein
VGIALVLRAGWRRTLTAAGVAALGCLSLVPWLVAASAQLSYAGQPFWVQPIDFASVSGSFVQFFGGPPIEPWVPWKPWMQVFQGIATASGILLIFVVVFQRRALGAAGRRAALFCTVGGIGAALLLFPLSVWHPLVDGRYGGVVWGPTYAILGAGLALLPGRRWVATGLAATLSATLALTLVPNRPDISSAIAALRTEVGAHDLIDAYPSEYLLLRNQAPEQLLARTVVLQPSVQWYWGTAVYPRGAITASVPASVSSAGGTVYAVMQPDDTVVPVPGGYSRRSSTCWLGVCIVAYRRG